MQGNKRFRNFNIGTVWLWLGLFALLPQLALFLVSFLDRGEIDFFIPSFTLGNFKRLFDPAFVNIFLDSLYLASVSTIVCLLVGYPFAYLLARTSKRLRPWLLLLVVIPFWTNSLIRTYALIIILKTHGLINQLLLWLGIVDGPFSLMYTDIAVFLGLTYTLLPFMILPLYASIEKLDTRLLDAAKDLGAGTLRSFWHITLPLTSPGIVAGCILVFLPALGIFYVPEILGGATNMLLGTFIKNQFLVARDWPLGAASSILLTLILVLMALVYRMVNRKAAAADPLAPPRRRRRGRVA
ncbi:MAG: spermidine/putrescine ABC transporter permease PotB [Deltaproteobacteria bacterium]|jgi:spermidine/putrescine transport system permease protein|nr:spermidine/putrescine ABC transporter permease PotB [Deltaproteobacteria bacterium]